MSFRKHLNCFIIQIIFQLLLCHIQTHFRFICKCKSSTGHEIMLKICLVFQSCLAKYNGYKHIYFLKIFWEYMLVRKMKVSCQDWPWSVWWLEYYIFISHSKISKTKIVKILYIFKRHIWGTYTDGHKFIFINGIYEDIYAVNQVIKNNR